MSFRVGSTEERDRDNVAAIKRVAKRFNAINKRGVVRAMPQNPPESVKRLGATPTLQLVLVTRDPYIDTTATFQVTDAAVAKIEELAEEIGFEAHFNNTCTHYWFAKRK